MPFRIQCSSGHILVIPERWAGAKFHCPKCGAAVLVPGIGQDEAIVLDGEIDSMILSTVPASSLVENTTAVIAPSPVLATVPVPTTATTTSSVNETPKRNAMDRHPTSLQENVQENLIAAPVANSAAKTAPVRPAKPQDPKQATALHLGMLVLAVAIFSILPAAWEWLAIWQHAGSQPIPPWVYLSLLAGAVLFAYGIYVTQLPDWSTLWVATVALLFTAACYAALFAATWLGTAESTLVSLLHYGDKLAGNRAMIWCLVMLVISSFTSYFLGHSAVQWYNAYRVQRQILQR